MTARRAGMHAVPDEPVRVLVVDESELVQHGLGHLLAADRWEVVVPTAGVGAGPGLDVDLVLFDAFAEVPARLDDVSRLSRQAQFGCVVYTWDAQCELVRLALGAGARGCLSKQLAGPLLEEALEQIVRGQVVVFGSGQGSSSPTLEKERLTRREVEVLALVTLGMSNEEVALHACVSINTVKSYIRSAYRKIGVRSRTQAVLWGLEQGFGRHQRLAADEAAQGRMELLEPSLSSR